MTFNAFSLFANVWVMLLLALPAYHFSRNIVLRRLILLTLGILIIFFVAPRLALAYLIFWTIVVIVQRFVLRTRDFGFATPALLLALALVLAPMVTWKLSPWWFMWELVAMRGHAAVAALSSTIGSIDANHQLFLPLGLSFATFRALDLLLQTYLHEIQKPTALSIMSYGFCPFLLPVGPIATIQEVDVDAVVTEFDIKYGLYRIVSGLVKVFLLASIFEPWGGVFHAKDRPAYQLILGLYVFVFYFYLNFAGYSDLAIGTGRLFGMKVPENFRWPLFRESPQQFWNNWHASLSRFASRYVFMAAGGLRKGWDYFAVLATMMVIAWWHDLNLQWTCFGVYHGIGLAAHRWWTRHRPNFIEKAKEKIYYRFASWVLLLTFVVFSFPIIFVPLNELPHFYLELLPGAPK